MLRRVIGCAQLIVPSSILDVGRIPPPRRMPARASARASGTREPTSQPRRAPARRGRSGNVLSEERNPRLRARNLSTRYLLSSGARGETNKSPLIG